MKVQIVDNPEVRSVFRERELRRIARSCAERAVDVLFIKGAGLAYTVYPAPHLRPSWDIDLFIDHGSRDAAEEALVTCGYARAPEPDGELVSAQRHFARLDGNGVGHFVDLHWGVSNVRLFRDAIAFADAWRSSVAMPNLDPAARTLGLADALLLACIHRVAHHHDAPNLRWLEDIHRVAGRMSAADWETFATKAERAQMRAVCSRGLQLAQVQFATALPQDVLERLTVGAEHERSARFLDARVRTIDVLAADLAATAGWVTRAALLREHLFPSIDYMRARYPTWPTGLLPLAYLDRIVRGAPGWFRRPITRFADGRARL